MLEQRIARAHRHGQPQSVQVINLVAKDTIEERMLDRLAVKRSVFAGVFGADESTTSIRFEDTGQGLLTQLGELLGQPVATELELAPVQPPEPVAPAAMPTLKGFADLLQARLPGRVLIVRTAPADAGVLVVTSGAPAELRPAVEAVLAEYFVDERRTLHLMDPEGYRALCAFFPAAAIGQEVAFSAPALPIPTGPSEEQLLQARRKQAQSGLAVADKRLALADLMRQGGFFEDMLHPAREALGWGLSSLLALYRQGEPGVELPEPRLVQAELVERGRLPDDLALQLSSVRELTAPVAPATQDAGGPLAAGGAPAADAPPPISAASAEKLAAALRALIDLARQQVVSAGL